MLKIPINQAEAIKSNHPIDQTDQNKKPAID